MGDPVGFRFHPTDEELVNHYLKNKMLGNEHLLGNVIQEVDFCKFEPWDLAEHSNIGSDDQVYFFFCAVDYKYMHSKRAKRTTENGYWKATGRDRKIKAKGTSLVIIGTKKTLVFHLGRPKGERTPWVVHEYHPDPSIVTPNQKPYVLCKLKNKGVDKVDTLPENQPEPLLENQPETESVQEVQENSSQVPETSLSFHGNRGTEGPQWSEQEEDIPTIDWQLLDDFIDIPDEQPYQGGFNEKGLEYVEDRHPLLVDPSELTWEEMFYQTQPNGYKAQESITGLYLENSSDTEGELSYTTDYKNSTFSVKTQASSSKNQMRMPDHVRLQALSITPCDGELSVNSKPSRRGISRRSQPHSKTGNKAKEVANQTSDVTTASSKASGSGAATTKQTWSSAWIQTTTINQNPSLRSIYFRNILVAVLLIFLFFQIYVFGSD